MQFSNLLLCDRRQTWIIPLLDTWQRVFYTNIWLSFCFIYYLKVFLIALAVLLQNKIGVQGAPLDGDPEQPQVQILRQEMSPSSHTFS